MYCCTIKIRKYRNDSKFRYLERVKAVRKGDNLLLEKINSGLKEIMTNGIYKQLTDKHL